MQNKTSKKTQIKDIALHPKVREFLKSRALDEMMTKGKALPDEDRKVLELCVAEAEFHRVLSTGSLPDKTKFVRMLMEAYKWKEPKKRAVGRPRKGSKQ